MTSKRGLAVHIEERYLKNRRVKKDETFNIITWPAGEGGHSTETKKTGGRTSKGAIYL